MTCSGTPSKVVLAPVRPDTGADKLSLCLTTDSTLKIRVVVGKLMTNSHLVDLLPGGRAVLKGCVLSLKCLRNARLVLRRCFGPVDGGGYVDRLAVDSVQVADRSNWVLPALQLWTLLVLWVVAVAVV